MSLQSKSLFFRLALVGALGSLLSVFALGTYVAYKQGKVATQSAYNESYLITSGLATAVASDLIVKNYGDIDQTVAQVTNFSKLDHLNVINKRGNIVVEAKRDQQKGTWGLFHGGVVKLPSDDQPLSTIVDNHIVTWMPINAGSLVGWVRSDMPLSQIIASQYLIFRDTFLVALLSVVLSIGVVIIALRRPIKQIRIAANFADELPKIHGQFLSLTSSTSELQDLVSALNRASKKLHNQDQELRESRDLAHEVAKSKSEFLANMSHEIRTPMNGIIGLTQLALNLPTDPVVKDYLSKVFSSSQSLLGILNDILDISKLEASRINIETRAFNLDHLLSNLRNMFEESATSKNIEFIIEVEASVPRHLLGDAMRIQQIISNLLGNAIKFTGQGSVAVKVFLQKLEKSKAQLTFSIEDTGIGIAQENFDKLFQPFSQVDGSITRKFGGTGLGLVISQSLLKLMGGEFDVHSQPGQGTAFRFSLQLGVAAQGAIQKNRSGSKVGNLERNLKEIGHNLQGTKVLVAEDQHINQKVISEFLRLAGIAAVISNNGQEALDLLEQEDFDAVLMDVHMPVMDGMEATRNIRSHLKYARLPIIAVTAAVTQEEQESYLACGMNAVLAKPVNPGGLIKLLSQWIVRQSGDSAKAVQLPVEQPTEQPTLQEHNQAKALSWADLSRVLTEFDLENIKSIPKDKPEFLLRMLQKFFDGFNDKAKIITDHINNGELDAAKTIIHTIKGVAGNLGAMNLHQACVVIESQLKQGEFDAKEFQAWLKSFDDTLLNIADLLHIQLSFPEK